MQGRQGWTRPVKSGIAHSPWETGTYMGSGRPNVNLFKPWSTNTCNVIQWSLGYNLYPGHSSRLHRSWFYLLLCRTCNIPPNRILAGSMEAAATQLEWLSQDNPYDCRPGLLWAGSSGWVRWPDAQVGFLLSACTSGIASSCIYNYTTRPRIN